MTKETTSNQPEITHNGQRLDWNNIEWPLQIPKTGSNFTFYRAKAHDLELMIGFGRKRINSRGLSCNSREYEQICLHEQTQLRNIFPHHLFPHLLPSQTTRFDDVRYNTVICIRDYVHTIAQLDTIQPHHFKQFPDLKKEFADFFAYLRKSEIKPDIKDPRNLVLDIYGHLIQIDQNSLMYPGDPTYDMVLRMQKAIGYMSAGDTTYTEAYHTIQSGELRNPR